jgi:hypothetical protein
MVTKSSEILTGANIARQTVTISFSDDSGGPEWWVCHGDGDVETFDTASAALRAVKRRAKMVMDATRTSAVILTTVQWLNVRDGFTPPK